MSPTIRDVVDAKSMPSLERNSNNWLFITGKRVDGKHLVSENA